MAVRTVHRAAHLTAFVAGRQGKLSLFAPPPCPPELTLLRFGRERSEHHSIGRARPPEAARAEAHRLVTFAHAAADARLRAARSAKRADRRHGIMSACLRTDKSHGTRACRLVGGLGHSCLTREQSDGVQESVAHSRFTLLLDADRSRP